MPGARTVRGGFDSHASPPLRSRLRPVLVLAGLLVLSRPGFTQTPAPDPGPPPGRVALQSLVLPGWGQASNRSWLKAAGFFGAYLRRGDLFIALRIPVHLLRAARRWLVGILRGDRDLAINGRAYVSGLWPGLRAGWREGGPRRAGT